MIIDSHCHLDYEPLNSNLEKVLIRASGVGVKYFLTICTKEESFEKILIILKKYKNIFGTYGIHPHETKSYDSLTIEGIKKKVLSDKKIIGIGETGLDFYYNHSDKISQKKCFIKHINACHETNKTLIVHTRAAEKETLDILSNENKDKKLKILMHCFTGSKSFANKLIDLNCYFSASGIITFKKSNDLANTFKSIPNNRILIETDSPYLSPEPLRGKTNEPGNLKYTLKFLANLKNETEENFSMITTNNFFKLFNINL
mgnify:CR=1 FL=1